MKEKPYAERLRRNSLSSIHAVNAGEPWDDEDVEALMVLWDGTEDTLAEIAEMLGRTIEACRQRYFNVLAGRTRNSTPKTPLHQSGWMYDFCTGCGGYTDVWCDGTNVKKCEECK